MLGGCYTLISISKIIIKSSLTADFIFLQSARLNWRMIWLFKVQFRRSVKIPVYNLCLSFCCVTSQIQLWGCNILYFSYCSCCLTSQPTGSCWRRESLTQTYIYKTPSSCMCGVFVLFKRHRTSFPLRCDDTWHMMWWFAETRLQNYITITGVSLNYLFAVSHWK